MQSIVSKRHAIWPTGSPARNTRNSKRNILFPIGELINNEDEDNNKAESKTRKASEVDFDEPDNKRACSSDEEDDADDREWDEVDAEAKEEAEAEVEASLLSFTIPSRDSVEVDDYFERLLGIKNEEVYFKPSTSTSNYDDSISSIFESSNNSIFQNDLIEGFLFPFSSIDDNEFDDLSSLI